MTDESKERELAREHGIDDPDVWGEPEEIPKAARLDVTISVRFTAAEIAQVRRVAENAGMKPTAFIRQAALAQTHAPLDVGALQSRVAAALAELQNLADVVARAEGKALPAPRGRRELAGPPERGL